MALFRSLAPTFEIQADGTGRDLQILGNVAVTVALSLELQHLRQQVCTGLAAVAWSAPTLGYLATDAPALGPSDRLDSAES